MKKYLMLVTILIFTLTGCNMVSNQKNLYQNVLDKYIEVVQVKSENNFQKFEDANLSYMFAYDNDLNLSEVYYSLVDVNNDRIEELLIYYKEANDVAEDPEWDNIIYDMYTIFNNEVVKALTSGERDRYYLLENGEIKNEGSSGAADSFVKYFKLNSEGELEEVEKTESKSQYSVIKKSLKKYQENKAI